RAHRCGDLLGRRALARADQPTKLAAKWTRLCEVDAERGVRLGRWLWWTETRVPHERKAMRHHTNHRKRLSGQPHGLPDNRSVRAEAIPQLVSQDDHRRMRRADFVP